MFCLCFSGNAEFNCLLSYKDGDKLFNPFHLQNKAHTAHHIGLIVKNRNRTNEFCKKYQINIRHSLLNYTEVMYFPRETWQNSCVSLARIYLFIWREVKGDNFYFVM